MSKFSLIVPNTRYNSVQLWSVLPSRGLLSLAACLKHNGFEVEYIDADFLNLSNDDVLSRIDTFGADVVGITMNTFQAKAGMDLAKTIRRKSVDLKIVVGGPHPSALRNMLLKDCPEIDIACVGEGEETIVDIAMSLQVDGDISMIKGISYRRNDAIYDNPDRELIKDLDKIPFPAYELAGDLECYPGAQPVLKKPSMHVMASRGCPYKCIFCTKSVWGNKVRFRKPERIIDEVEFLHKKFGINEVFFQDDTMNVNRKWFFTICDEIITRKLNSLMAFKTPFRVNKSLVDEKLLEKAKEAGFWMIFYGVESGNQKVLDTIKKGTTVAEIERAFKLTHKAGIKTIAAFMVGNLGDTEETIQDSVELAKRIKPEVFGFSTATPLPGTEFYEIAKKQGWIYSDDFSEWSQFTAVSRNAGLTAEKITELRDLADKQVRDFLDKKRGDSMTATLLLKNCIKAVPGVGTVALRIHRFIKSCRQSNMPVSNPDYSKLDTEQIRREMDKRYSKGNAYPATKLWDDVRTKEVNEQCMSMISPTDGKKILELGCALCGTAPCISSCDEYIGTDLSPEVIKASTRLFGHKPGFSFAVMDALDLKFEANRFDIVIAKEVIEHVPDVERLFKEAFRVLRPGGNILITSPNLNSLHLRINRLLGYKDFTCCFDHINEMTFERASGIIEKVGFNIIATAGVFLQPYWGIPVIDIPVRKFTDDDPATVEMLRELGRLCGAKYAFCYIIKAQKTNI